MKRLERPLTAAEERVLGSLLEKELATPDAYPLTENALLAACNQRSNRDPVLALEPPDVAAALRSLMERVLVWRERGSRATRWKHDVEAKWGLAPPPRALLAELLLRGPQTPGQLRAHGERLVPLPDLDAVLGVLADLAAGADPLVEELPRDPGQKENRWRHRLGAESEGAAPTRIGDPLPRSVAAAEPATDLASRVAALEARLDRLEAALGQAHSEP